MTTSPAEHAYRDAFGLYAKGNLFLALSALREALERWPEELPLLRLHAQLLSRAGAYSQAIQACVRLLLRDEGLRGEVFPILGKAYKELWLATGQREALYLARHYYQQSHAEGGDYYPGINAATLSLLCGDGAEAERLARQVLERLSQGGEGEDEHWRSASAGEAELILGHASAALTHYQAAASAVAGRYGDLASMRKQVLLLQALRPVAELLEHVLILPGIAVFAGHRIDAEERVDGRFPPSREAAVRARIAEAVHDKDIRIGYASAAAGADLLFQEVMQAQGRETNIVLPFAAGDFVEASVRPSGEAWVGRFEAVLARATRLCHVTPEAYLGDTSLFEQANLVIEGLARLRAQQLDAPLHFLAVCGTPSPEAKPGGTQASLARWEALGCAPLRIDPHPGHAVSALPDSSGEATSTGQRRCLALLFADVVGYSRLAERELMAEHQRLLARVSARLVRVQPPPLHRNTWGDGLFLVFEDLGDAADFALGLLDDLAQPREDGGWALSARISLHFGPAYVFHDSVIERLNVLGTSVNRAARIEPVTPPGEVYLTQEAAALLAATARRRFHLEYIGPVSLPKGFGTSELFKLARQSPGNFDR
ncbi:MAG: hypothetical protein HYV16_02650 [Gammaproteobacteria bacterium]|nr:hypothetical protein [Gammaproteobacteria bacterium]